LHLHEVEASSSKLPFFKFSWFRRYDQILKVEKDVINIGVHKHRDLLVHGFKKKIGDKSVFLCDICGLVYVDRKTAQECEDYCRAHHDSCSAEINAKAVFVPSAPVLPRKE